MDKSLDEISRINIWSNLLPSNISIDGGHILDDGPPLTACEFASAGIINSDRLLEFRTGRAYAKRALSMLGVNDVELPMRGDRSPAWPPGIVGSITHTRSGLRQYFAAAAARDDEIRAIGIDAEYAIGFDPQIWPTILTEAELCQIRGLPVDQRKADVIYRWCIKEATLKAARQLFELRTIETERGEIEGHWRASTPRRSGAEWWPARATNSDGLVLAAVVVQA